MTVALFCFLNIYNFAYMMKLTLDKSNEKHYNVISFSGQTDQTKEKEMTREDKMTDWNSKFNEFDRNLIEALAQAGVNGDSGTGNIISDALVSDFNGQTFVERFGGMTGFNKGSISRLATLCQMKVYDSGNGPDGDGEPKGLRRHWYAWFKVTFSQWFSQQLADCGDDKESTDGYDGRAWAQRLSKIYSDLVDFEDVTYKQLWVSDSSRLSEAFWNQLFNNSNIVLAVEKDSLFGDFKTAAKAIGAKVLVSGRGKMSKAATELMLREHFGWSERWDRFTAENPLIVLTLTDWDFDGESVIAPTFAEQARRYTPHVKEARVGIFPEQGIAKNGPLFEAKTNNATYLQWIEEKGLFDLECAACGNRWIHVGHDSWDGASCPNCDNQVLFNVKTKKSDGEVAYGFEVEALKTRDYYAMIVDALLTVLDFDELIERLRDECKASSYKAARRMQSFIADRNETYQKLLATIEKLEAYKDAFEADIEDHFRRVGEPHEKDWRNDDDNPEVDVFRNYVQSASRYEDAWRPFSEEDRTAKLVRYLTYGDLDSEEDYEEAEAYDEFDDSVQDFISLNIFKEYRVK